MITFRRVTKVFGAHRALDDVSLEVERGEVVALLGPNGSGKTTSLKIAVGLTRPTSGEALIGDPGRPPVDPDARESLSFLPQRVTFPESLTGREVVEFYRSLRGVAIGRTQEVLRFASPNGAGDRLVGTYSGGMVQRLGLAVAMLPDTPMLVLDEPTAALDPDGLCAFYGLVERRRREGKAVLFSSHQLGDVERLAGRFAVLVEGHLVASLSQRELSDRLSSRGVMRLRLGSRPADLLERVRALAPAATWLEDQLIVPGAVSLRPAVLDAVRGAGVEILGLTAEEGRLDTFYRELVAVSS